MLNRMFMLMLMLKFMLMVQKLKL